MWGLGAYIFHVSVSKFLTLAHNFWIVGDRDFIFDIHFQQMKPFDTRVINLVTLTMTFILKMAHLDFVVVEGIHV